MMVYIKFCKKTRTKSRKKTRGNKSRKFVVVAGTRARSGNDERTVLRVGRNSLRRKGFSVFRISTKGDAGVATCGIGPLQAFKQRSSFMGPLGDSWGLLCLWCRTIIAWWAARTSAGGTGGPASIEFRSIVSRRETERTAEGPPHEVT